MVNNNLLNISTCLKMKDRKANSYVTTMLWDYITLMTPKSRMETAFVFFFRAPNVAAKWSGPCTYAVKKTKNPPARRSGFSKKFKTSGTGKNLLNPRKKGTSNGTSKKQDCLRTPVKLY